MPKGIYSKGKITEAATIEAPADWKRFIGISSEDELFQLDQHWESRKQCEEYAEHLYNLKTYPAQGFSCVDGSEVEFEIDCSEREDTCIESNCTSIEECKYHSQIAVPLPSLPSDSGGGKEESPYWKGFDYALDLLDEMYAKQHPHPYNIADCIKAKVNRLSKSDIRSTPPQEVEAEGQQELWNELGQFIHGGHSFTWYPEKLAHLQQHYMITKK